MKYTPILLALLCVPALAAEKTSLPTAHITSQVKPVSAEQAREYKLDAKFYKKCTLVQNILIATSERVPDVVHLEAAYLLDTVMGHLPPPVAQRIRDKKVLCVLVGHAELQSDVPQWATDKTGKELDFYNWRGRGELTEFDGRPTFLFSEEDVMEYPGGMDLESVLIHEFAHVIDGVGFDKTLQERLRAAFRNAKDKGLYMDGYAAQKFRRVTSVEPVGLLDALVKAFPAQPRDFLARCLDGGDILVNGKPARADVKVTRDDKVLIVFGGPKATYWALNKAEYWAEGVQAWYDTCRTMDHDHNHVHTRDQLKAYDPELAKLIADVLGDTPWRFVSPRARAGTGHLAGYDPSKAPKVVPPEHIDRAGQDYYDEYWKDYWQRLHAKYPAKAAAGLKVMAEFGIRMDTDKWPGLHSEVPAILLNNRPVEIAAQARAARSGAVQPASEKPLAAFALTSFGTVAAAEQPIPRPEGKPAEKSPLPTAHTPATSKAGPFEWMTAANQEAPCCTAHALVAFTKRSTTSFS